MQQDAPSAMRLWQLISPTLPIGAYAYSAGLEYAVEVGWINNESSAADWILGQLRNNLSHLDVPVFLRLYDAWENHQLDQVAYWNSMILALRESAELRQEDLHLGAALQRVLSGLDVVMPNIAADDGPEESLAFVSVFAFACCHWHIDKQQAAQGLLWSWCENQVAAAIKLVPLGQTSGQRLMSTAINVIEDAMKTATACDDDAIGLLAPGLAIASARHETQYTRLFRS